MSHITCAVVVVQAVLVQLTLQLIKLRITGARAIKLRITGARATACESQDWLTA